MALRCDSDSQQIIPSVACSCRSTFQDRRLEYISFFVSHPCVPVRQSYSLWKTFCSSFNCLKSHFPYVANDLPVPSSRRPFARTCIRVSDTGLIFLSGKPPADPGNKNTQAELAGSFPSSSTNSCDRTALDKLDDHAFH